jgi:hypothetical protein
MDNLNTSFKLLLIFLLFLTILTIFSFYLIEIIGFWVIPVHFISIIGLSKIHSYYLNKLFRDE